MTQSDTNKTSSKTPLLKALAWATQPGLVYGIGFGIAFTVAFIVSAQLGIITNVLVGFLALLFLSVFGALFFFFMAQAMARKFNLKDLVTAASETYGPKEILSDVRTFTDKDEADKAKWEAVENRLGNALSGLFALVGNAIGRYFSLVFLVSILGGAATFAIFAATFIQAERLAVQNRLIESQLHLAEAQRQTALAVSLENLENELGRLQGSGGEVVLPEPLILKIVALSRTFRPYRFVEYSLQNTLNVVQQDLLPFDAEFGVRLTRTPLSQERSRLLSQIIFAPISNMEALHQKGPIFQFSDFREYFLSQQKLDCFDLRSSDFRESYGFAASFRGAQLQRTDFSYANMTGVDFSSADTEEENTPCPTTVGAFHPDRNTNLTNSNFSFARLNRGNFNGAVLDNVTFSNSILFGTTFIDSQIAKANFDGAIVHSGDKAPGIEAIADGFFGEATTDLKEGFLSSWKVVAEKPDHPFLNDANLDDTVYYVLRSNS